MSGPAGPHTLPGTRLPDGDLPPTLLFHKWQRYDRFVQEMSHGQGRPKELEAFAREDTGYGFLSVVARRVQEAGRVGYRAWYQRFSAACESVGAEEPLTAKTYWRMVVGWATNPALEVGVTLDHLLGFPYVPGSAVKGLLHRMAELELGERVPPPPAGDGAPSPTPPPELATAVGEALLVRALFGSVHVRSGQGEPPSALVALERWRERARIRARTPNGQAWNELLPRLENACSDTAAGGMVTCFDAVPTKTSFEEERDLLTVDVLTPHDPKPNPIHFLAVRDGVRFELRYRLAPWPTGEPRDPEEAARAEALAGTDRETAMERLHGWLVRGLTEHGLGGKTSAGYGYLHPHGQKVLVPALLESPPPPEPPDKKDDDDNGVVVEPPEKDDDDSGGVEEPTEEDEVARKLLPDGIDSGRATAMLDKKLAEPPSASRTAVARRFVALFQDRVEDWATSQARSKVKRTLQIREALGDEEEETP